MLKDYALQGLEAALNQIIKLDPDHETLLEPLASKTIKLDNHFPPIEIYCQFNTDSVQILHYHYLEPDCTIAGSTLAFISSTLNNEQPHPDLKISGDTDVAQDFAHLSQHLNIDWEELLAKVLGDSAAHATGQTLRNIAQIGKDLVGKVQENTRDFVKHESGCIPNQEEVSQLLDKIDTLRHDVARVEARFKQFKRTHKGNACDH